MYQTVSTNTQSHSIEKLLPNRVDKKTNTEINMYPHWKIEARVRPISLES